MTSGGKLLCTAVAATALLLLARGESIRGYPPAVSHYTLSDGGQYAYDFDAGNGYAGQQAADQRNEVHGHYSYYDDKGVQYTIRYRAGVHGYEPETVQVGQAATAPVHHRTFPTGGGGSGPALEFVRNAVDRMQRHQGRQPPPPIQVSYNSQHGVLQPPPPPEVAQPYQFSYLADQSSHSESADAGGNVVGKYSYYDEAGYHDIAYKAGDDIGFVVLGGNLADPQTASGSLASSSVVVGGKPQLIVQVAQPHGSYNYKVDDLRPPTKTKKTIHTGNSSIRRHLNNL